MKHLRAFGSYLRPLWRGTDAVAIHPRLGLGAGLVLVALLVPGLNIWNGVNGPLSQSIPLFFLVPVLVASALGGRWPGVLVACIALVVWDWFFIKPLYTITIASARDVTALVVFLVVAILVGQLSVVARRRTQEAVRRAKSSEALYDLSMALIAGRNLDEVLPTLTRRLRDTFDLEACAVLMPVEGSSAWRTMACAGRLPRDLRVEENRSLATTATYVQSHGAEQVLGHVRRGPGHTERMARIRPGEERARFLPLQVGSHAVGVLELVPRVKQRPDPEQERLLTTLANGAAIAVEQSRLVREEQAAAVAKESDRLKSALLSSVSHDLRTPLAGIKAAASSLLQEDVEWSAEDRRAFLVDIDHEADRLTRLVSNLLDLSRIEAGAIKPTKEWEDIAELIDRVLRRITPRLGRHTVRAEIPDDLPQARIDAVEIEQVLTNLVENAAKYSSPGTEITLRAQVVDVADRQSQLEISVTDQGTGIPPREQERIFDKFYRVAGGVRGVSGTGMGLAIVKGFVEAHGGTVGVQSTPGVGSTFIVRLPLDSATPTHQFTTTTSKLAERASP